MATKIEAVMSEAEYGSVTKYNKARQAVEKRCLKDCMNFYDEYSNLIKQTLYITQQLLSKNRTDGEKRHLERELEWRKPVNDRLVQEVVDGAYRLSEIAEKEKAEKETREKTGSNDKNASYTAIQNEIPKDKSLEMEFSKNQDDEKGRSKNHKTPKKLEAAARRPFRLKQYYYMQELQRKRAEESKSATSSQASESIMNEKSDDTAEKQGSAKASSSGENQLAVIAGEFESVSSPRLMIPSVLKPRRNDNFDTLDAENYSLSVKQAISKLI
ncbi:hypothetical protein L3Y34_013096 [Caenorhabditis briggsae]|uniref:Uncharacterized protein n=1 Tax=Caenorhabditis briggsae TaxID=6238 RepID=A0AAE8ZW61_CAEBR|nr:hypothetical protein L3Y34_013096 [Caenorhabditis briggsae]